jgi:Uma2 family endonuclease
MKLRSYARAGIVEYWIVNLLERQVEVYTTPAPEAIPPTYAPPRVIKADEEIAVVLGGKEWLRVAASEILPAI